MTAPASAPPPETPSGAAARADESELAVALVDPPSSAELVEGMAATWRAALVEAAGGSTLVDVEELGDAVLDLSAAHPSGLAQLFAGRPTRLSSLVREGAALAGARRRARAVTARSTVYTHQYGIAPTSLAIGVASWVERTVPDLATDDVAALASATKGSTANETPLPTPRVVRAPVLLRPVTLKAKGAAESDYELSLEPTIEVNPVLARALRARGALLDPGAVARGTFTDSGFDPHGALARLASLGWAVLEDFTLTERVVVGTFVHPGQVLVDDLDILAPSLERHEVLAALAGVDQAQERISRGLPKAPSGDRDPSEDRGLGDLDPAQQHLLDVVASGAHVFVDAPAGADVTGTLAALVADAAAAGRTVLYVPGHRRAAAALAERLERLGVGELLLDVAPEAGWRSTASRRLLAAMTLEPPVLDDRGIDEVRRALVAHREALRGYVRGLHAPRQPWGVSAYDALQELTRLTASRPTPKTTVRLDPDVARVLDAHGRAEAAADLLRAGELGAFSLRPSDTPWYGADLRTPADAKIALARVNRLLDTLPAVIERAGEVAADAGLARPENLQAWDEQLRLLDEVRASLDVFQPMVFERTAADLVAATASKAWRTEHGVEMGRVVRRRLRRQAKDMVRPGRPVADLHAALLDVQRRRELWQRHCPGGGWPRLPAGLEGLEADHRAIHQDLDALDEVLAATPEGGGLSTLPMEALVARLTRLRDAGAALDTLPARTALVRHLRAGGLGALVDDLAERRVPATLAPAELELAWWTTVFEQILAADPALAGYDGTTLGALSARYAELDRAHVASLAGPAGDAAIRAMGSALRQHRDQAEGLFSELIEERVTSLRDVMVKYPDVARRLRPVISASPMLVPQVLPPARTVDLVVLDAATRMPVEVAVSAIARGRQVVVVGDARCASGTAVRELAAVLPRFELHADASRRDPWLTAFLVGHGYEGALVPMPLPSLSPLVRFERVDGTGLPGVESGIVDSTREEVDRVVELVVEHALARPDESLAVVTATVRHADAVRDQVLGEARANPALASFFDTGRPDPFVVVDLASIAGLRRDAVILSLGLGRTPHRRVLHSFGAISAPGGDALLLDAIGCTQHRLTVVSCFGADDLDPDRLRGPGARLLGDLLAFAERRGRGDGDPLAPLVRPGAVDTSSPASDEPASAPVATPEPDRLVLDLAERLWRHGLTVDVDHGIPGGVRVPLAVGHPDVPERMLVAVLTDDQAYVDEPSVRVRDRLVPERLEHLGWSAVRVWSAAAFLDPQAEVDRIRRAVHAALPAPRSVPLSPRRAPALVDEDGWAAAGAVPPAAEPAVAPAAESRATPAAESAATPAGEPVVVPADLAEAPVKSVELPVASSELAEAAAAVTSAELPVASAELPTASTELPAPRRPKKKGRAVMPSVESVTGSVPPQRSAAPAEPAPESADPQLQAAGSDGGPPVRVATGVLRTVPKPHTGEVQLSLAVPTQPRPDIRKGLPIGAYSDDQLDELAAWLRSDGQERTRDELADALRAELGLTRRNHRVDTAIRGAVTRAMR